MSRSIDEKIISLINESGAIPASKIIDGLSSEANSSYINKRIKVLADHRRIKLIQNAALLSDRIYGPKNLTDFVSTPSYELTATEFSQDLKLIDEPVTITFNRVAKGVYIPVDQYKELCKKADDDCV